jgi:hypothetical protein
MNIGLFGDSYIDLQWHRYPGVVPKPEQHIWAHRLLNELGSPILSSGRGGTDQYYAIATWLELIKKTDNVDYAIFTFTWHHRITPPGLINQKVVTAYTEKRDIELENQSQQNIQNAIEQYYDHLYNEEKAKFEFELMVKWILELPVQYPKIKFIFMPNTEHARQLANKYFSNGVLLDFSFETLSLAEGERVGEYPFVPDRCGHLSDQLHEKVKNMVKDIIINYDNYANKVYSVDYNRFELKKIINNFYKDDIDKEKQ